MWTTRLRRHHSHSRQSVGAVEDPRPNISSVIRIASGGLIVRAASIGSGLLFASVLSFLLEKAQYGIVVTIVSMALFASAFGEFGQRDFMAREISRALARNDTSKALSLAWYSTALVALTGSLVGVVVFFVCLLSGFQLLLSAAAGGITIALCLDGSWSGTGRAFGQFIWAMAPRDIIWRTSAVIVIAVCVLFAGLTIDATAAAFVLLACLLCASALQLGMLRILTRSLLRGARLTRLKVLPILHSSRDLTIAWLGGAMLVTLDVVVVGLLLGDVAAAEYFPANRISILLLSIQITFQFLFAPQFARAFAVGDMESMKRQARFGAVLASAGTLIGFVGLSFFSSLLPYIFATATPVTWTLTIILSIASLMCALFGYGSNVLIAIGHEADIRRITLWALPLAGVGLTLGALLWGEIGVASMVAAIASARMLAIAVACYRRVGFAATAFG